MAIKMKTVIKMAMEAECVSHSRTDVKVRDLIVHVDEPPERGGTNAGASPTETLMASLAGCTNVIGHKCAKKNGVDIVSMDIKLSSTFDRRGVTLDEEVEIPFPEVTLEINLTTPSDDDAVEGMKRDLRKYCPVAKVFRHSGSRIEEVWNVTRP